MLDEVEGAAKALAENELALIAANPKQWKLLVRLLAATGLRIGEALALRWGDIDLGRKPVSVRRRIYRGEFVPPKSRYGRRDVPLRTRPGTRAVEGTRHDRQRLGGR